MDALLWIPLWLSFLLGVCVGVILLAAIYARLDKAVGR